MRTAFSRSCWLGGYEAASNILVFQEPDTVWNTTFLRKSHSCVDSRIGNADDYICVNRAFPRQRSARRKARRMNRRTLDDRIRARKVDIFKYAEGRLLSTMAAVRLYALLAENHDLTGLNVANKVGVNRVKSTGFGGNDVLASSSLAVAERPEAVRIAEGNELGGGHEDARISPLQLRHGAGDGILGRCGVQPFPDDGINYGFGIGRT